MTQMAYGSCVSRQGRARRFLSYQRRSLRRIWLIFDAGFISRIDRGLGLMSLRIRCPDHDGECRLAVALLNHDEHALIVPRVNE